MKKIIPYIKSATPLPQYRLLVEFEDGRVREPLK